MSGDPFPYSKLKLENLRLAQRNGELVLEIRRLRKIILKLKQHAKLHPIPSKMERNCISKTVMPSERKQ